jgi:predicted DNA-binding protein
MAKKDIKVTFMLTPRLLERLESYAESVEKSKSEVLRDLIEDHLPEVSKNPESLSNPEK